jgi:hypothetical protein
MSNLRIAFNTDNAAFSEDRGAEIARILRSLANVLECADNSSDEGTVHDINGNTVGKWNLPAQR